MCSCGLHAHQARLTACKLAVECDACCISVHESCYGITVDDTESIHSNASSASTEPWFCDACKANVKKPMCELCPNSGGIYKITDNERYVGSNFNSLIMT